MFGVLSIQPCSAGGEVPGWDLPAARQAGEHPVREREHPGGVRQDPAGAVQELCWARQVRWRDGQAERRAREGPGQFCILVFSLLSYLCCAGCCWQVPDCAREDAAGAGQGAPGDRHPEGEDGQEHRGEQEGEWQTKLSTLMMEQWSHYYSVHSKISMFSGPCFVSLQTISYFPRKNLIYDHFSNISRHGVVLCSWISLVS